VGYDIARFARLDVVRCRTIAIEVGMQNSGLGAVLAVTPFCREPPGWIAVGDILAFGAIYPVQRWQLLVTPAARYESRNPVSMNQRNSRALYL
jgi:bile acid:Na+ symporter, BASS family